MIKKKKKETKHLKPRGKKVQDVSILPQDFRPRGCESRHPLIGTKKERETVRGEKKDGKKYGGGNKKRKILTLI